METGWKITACIAIIGGTEFLLSDIDYFSNILTPSLAFEYLIFGKYYVRIKVQWKGIFHSWLIFKYSRV